MIKPNEEIFQYYFYFIEERMNIFWNRYENNPHLTDDEIFSEYKFTNVYRVLDRVSQYLVKNVIYTKKNFSDEDILFRILLFKIFNKIETWEALEKEFGELRIKNFNRKKMSIFLQKLRNKQPIFNNAYIMTGSHHLYNHLQYKHEKWLEIFYSEIMGNRVLQKIISTKSLEEVYLLLRECSFIGDFLAYQYAIDLNYASVINFDENSFVKAGIGAIRGIKKCFGEKDKKYSYEDYIRFTQENFTKYQEKFGHTNFKNLFGRNPTLIDLQNCFCETDKYLRVKIPSLSIDNTRIKQRYKPQKKDLEIFLPPKRKLF